MKFRHLLFSLIFILTSVFAADHHGTVTDTKFIYQIHNGDPYVFSLGYIKNNAETPLEDISIEIRYFDQSGELIDSAYENIYSLVVPPNEKVSFKVQTYASSGKESYVAQEVRIVNAVQSVPCNNSSRKQKSQSNYDLLKKTFINWVPLLVIIAIWVVLVRKYSGKGSNQQRLVELMEQQVKYDEARNEEIANIAESLKIRHGDNDSLPGK